MEQFALYPFSWFNPVLFILYSSLIVFAICHYFCSVIAILMLLEFSLMEQDFTEFRESDKSLKHELGSIWRSCLSHVSCWHCGSILVSYTRGTRFTSFYCNDKYFCHSIQRIQWKHLGTTQLFSLYGFVTKSIALFSFVCWCHMLLQRTKGSLE